MKLKNLGMLSLSIWLVSSGVLSVLGISSRLSMTVLALLAIAAGLLILLDIARGPTKIGKIDPDPKKYIGTECLPPGSPKPTGARIKVLNLDGSTAFSWDFSCEGLADAIREVTRINDAFCVRGDTNVPSATVEGKLIEPFQSTTTGTKGVGMGGANGFLFPCSDVPELINALSQAFSGCCL
jgi:hypothetical protein